MADFAAARGRDYAAAANYAGHYQGLLDASRASHQFGWHHLPPALHSMQGNILNSYWPNVRLERIHIISEIQVPTS